jgi:hypothetical protein
MKGIKVIARIEGIVGIGIIVMGVAEQRTLVK